MKLLKHPWLMLVLCASLVTALWLPAAGYPVLDDTAVYALLGRSFWTQGTYELLGVPFSRQLPLQAILSYPLTILFGISLGMKLSSLLAGIGVCIVSYFLFRRMVSTVVGLAVAFLIAVHPGFTYMTMVGSADLLFTFLFLLTLLALLKAEDDPSSGSGRWYIAAGTLAGLSCLTRYNGVGLFVLFVIAPFFVVRDAPPFGFAQGRAGRLYRSPWFWGGLMLGLVVFSLWFIRNAITFGHPFAVGYVDELQENTPGLLRQFIRNVVYYGNPLHNVFFVLFPFALVGLWKEARRHSFLLIAMLVPLPLTMVWHVQGIRFAFPAYPILTGFAVLGLSSFLRGKRALLPVLLTFLSLGLFAERAAVQCIYTYGACNAAFDRTIGLLPKNLHLSTEGFHALAQARAYLNAHAASGASVLVEYDVNAEVWKQGVYRPDLRVTSDTSVPCPAYWLTHAVVPGWEPLFRTEDEPRAYVLRKDCE